MELSPMDKMIIPGLFSPQEKQSLYQVMCAVRQIGNHHMMQKENHIHEVMAIAGITSNDQIQSRTLTQPQMTGILKRMEDGKKLYSPNLCLSPDSSVVSRKKRQCLSTGSIQKSTCLQTSNYVYST